MYLITGGAGFIGSSIVRELNDRGIDEIIVVDNLTDGKKFSNLADCRIRDYLDKDEFRSLLGKRDIDYIKYIIHQGACTNTLEQDGRYLMDNNFTFSKDLLHHALEYRIPFVYASSAATYGGAGRRRDNFKEIPECERPVNAYGWSKLVFDQYVRRFLYWKNSTIVGLRYFNVYGPRETNKGPMASMIYQIWKQISVNRTVKLFGASHGFDAGEQRRDFVYVKDVVDANLHFAHGPERTGIVNVGCGESSSFNEITNIIKEIMNAEECRIDYIPFALSLRDSYQSYTEADLSNLRSMGYANSFTSIQKGITEAVAAWTANRSQK